MRGGLQRGVQAGQRAGETGDAVADDPEAEGGVTLTVAVGADQQLVDLRRQAFRYPGRQRPPAQFQQALVHALHAPAAAAGQDDAGDARARHQQTSVRHAC